LTVDNNVRGGASVPLSREPRDEAEIHLRELERAIGTDIVLLAEQDARPVGLAVARGRHDIRLS
jgi:hypothetical protein